MQERNRKATDVTSGVERHVINSGTEIDARNGNNWVRPSIRIIKRDNEVSDPIKLGQTAIAAPTRDTNV